MAEFHRRHKVVALTRDTLFTISVLAYGAFFLLPVDPFNPKMPINGWMQFLAGIFSWIGCLVALFTGEVSAFGSSLVAALFWLAHPLAWYSMRKYCIADDRSAWRSAILVAALVTVASIAIAVEINVQWAEFHAYLGLWAWLASAYFLAAACWLGSRITDKSSCPRLLGS